MNFRSICLASFLLGAASTGYAAPMLSYISQTRHVTGRVEFPDRPGGGLVLENSVTAPDFGLFDQFVAAFDAGYAATAQQTSGLYGDRFEIDGQVQLIKPFEGTESVLQNATTFASIEFSIAEETAFTLSGGLGWSIDTGGDAGPAAGEIETRLFRDDGTPVGLLQDGTAFPTNNANHAEPRLLSGVIAAGAYRLDIATTIMLNSGAGGFGGDGTASMSFVFQIPEPATAFLLLSSAMLLFRTRRGS